MKLGLDLDSTITAEPKVFSALAKAVKAEGGAVYIIHGASGTQPVADDLTEAKALLAASGMTGLYDELYVAPKPIATNKADYAKSKGVDLFIDNRKKNARKTSKAGVPSAHLL